MGKSYTPERVLEFKGFTNHTCTPMAWRGRVPSVEGLKQVVMEHVVSTMPGFANEHIGKAYGIQVPSYACVRTNGGTGSKVLVEWRAPMFITLPDPKDFPRVARLRQS